MTPRESRCTHLSLTSFRIAFEHQVFLGTQPNGRNHFPIELGYTGSTAACALCSIATAAISTIPAMS